MEPTTAEDPDIFFLESAPSEEVSQLRVAFYGGRDRVYTAGPSILSVTGTAMTFVDAPTGESLWPALELIQLREKLKALESQVAHLAEATLPVQERVIILRSITREDAKNEIVRLFQAGDVLDYGDIAERLQIELPLVVDICNELEREGIIGGSS